MALQKPFFLILAYIFWLWICVPLSGLALSSPSLSAQSLSVPGKPPQAQAGVLDLRTWSLRQQAPLKLTGEWRFRFGQSTQQVPIRVPGRWEQLEKLPLWRTQLGQGRYTLHVNFAPADVGQVLRLRTRFQGSAYACYFEGQLVAHSGTHWSGELIASRRNRFLPFVLRQDKGLLYCDVSNLAFHRSGLIEPLWLGLDSEISLAESQKQTVIALALGFVFFLALYHLLLWGILPRNRLALWFGLTILSATFYYDLMQTHLFESLLGLDSFELSLRLTRLMLYGATFLMFKYLQALFPEETSPTFIRALTWPVWGLLLATLVLPSPLHSLSLLPFWGLHLAQLLYAVWVTFQAVRHKREGAYFFLGGFAAYLLLALHDILHNMELIRSQDLVLLGYVIFSFCQAILLARRFSQAFVMRESLTQELQSLNLELEAKVLARTEDLNQAKARVEALSEARETLTEMIIHDLKTPLGVILAQDNSQVGAWQQIREAGRQMQLLIQNLLDLSQARNTALQLKWEEYELLALVQEALQELHFYAERRNIFLKTDLPEGVLLNCDVLLLRRVLVNLLSNAIKYAPPGSTVALTGQFAQAEVTLTIRDQGKGISEQQKQRLFEKFQTGHHESELFLSSTGLGLAFCKLATEALGGKISLNSQVAKGTEVKLALPQARQQITERAPAGAGVSRSSEEQLDRAGLSKELGPLLTELRGLQVYQFSRLEAVLASSNQTLSPQAQNWLSGLRQAINAFDQEGYSRLLAGLNEDPLTESPNSRL